MSAGAFLEASIPFRMAWARLADVMTVSANIFSCGLNFEASSILKK
jgi:hypothetical protein